MPLPAAPFEVLSKALGLPLSSAQFSLLDRHLQLLQRWNRHINLTSTTKVSEIIRRHFGESLFLASMLPVDATTLVDIGSGAGFPGLPVAVARPGLRVTLVESVRKKAAFLSEVAFAFPNVRVFHGRFEDIHGHFDWAVARGVPLRHLIGPIAAKASALAVITGAAEAQNLASSGSFSWRRPALVPTSNGRVLIVGCNAA